MQHLISSRRLSLNSYIMLYGTVSCIIKDPKIGYQEFSETSIWHCKDSDFLMSRRHWQRARVDLMRPLARNPSGPASAGACPEHPATRI